MQALARVRYYSRPQQRDGHADAVKGREEQIIDGLLLRQWLPHQEDGRHRLRFNCWNAPMNALKFHFFYNGRCHLLYGVPHVYDLDDVRSNSKERRIFNIIAAWHSFTENHFIHAVNPNLHTIGCRCVCVCPNNKLRIKWPLTYIFGMAVHHEPVWANFVGQDSRSKLNVTRGKIMLVAGATSSEDWGI